jgi:hypothetical protein
MECSRNFPIVWMTGYTGKVKRREPVTFAFPPQTLRGGSARCVRVMDGFAVVFRSKSHACQTQHAWGIGS